MIAVLIAAVIAVLVFDQTGGRRLIRSGDETFIQKNKIEVRFREPPTAPIEVIDSKGRNVAVSSDIDGNVATVQVRAKEPTGFVCGPMIVKSGDVQFAFRIRAHHGNCEDHQH